MLAGYGAISRLLPCYAVDLLLLRCARQRSAYMFSALFRVSCCFRCRAMLAGTRDVCHAAASGPAFTDCPLVLRHCRRHAILHAASPDAASHALLA